MTQDLITHGGWTFIVEAETLSGDPSVWLSVSNAMSGGLFLPLDKARELAAALTTAADKAIGSAQ